jgi:2,3-bisphosphoglycerate-independent phosphoglycerate mutase
MSKVLLVILDGWGIAKDKSVSAVDHAGELYFHSLIAKYPHSTLTTHGKEVGLPEGQMGNSEVGHLNIGAGRIVYQELQRIHHAIATGEFEQNPKLNETINYCLSNDKPLHLIGLYSDGGVHSHTSHFLATVDFALSKGVKAVYIHAFTDGRDCDPKSGRELLGRLEQKLEGKQAYLASICGRYYAMDRDKRWERIRVAYDLLVHGVGEETSNVQKTFLDSYETGVTDEFFRPIVTKNFRKIEANDAVFCINFRTDRCRQITQALTQQSFAEYAMRPLPLHYATMTEYSKDFKNVDVLFKNDNIENTLGEVLEQNNMTQLRVAETEKYPHVTFFFSGGREHPFVGEERLMLSSPKVAIYDLQPEMSAYLITDALLEKIENASYDFIVVNYANTDMVGHTGDFQAAIYATQAVDKCLKSLVPKAQANDYTVVIIADHGNSEQMKNSDGTPHTAHTTNLVPILVLNTKVHLRAGKLADVAPTILDIMGISKPSQMGGESLLEKL